MGNRCSVLIVILTKISSTVLNVFQPINIRGTYGSQAAAANLRCGLTGEELASGLMLGDHLQMLLLISDLDTFEQTLLM